MAYIAFTWNWRIKCKKESLVDNSIYYYDAPANTDRTMLTSIATELRRRGFINVEIELIENIP